MREVKKPTAALGLAGWWKLRTGAAARNALLVSSGSRCATRAGPCRMLSVNDMVL